jgi:CheY-like chemotaxis protein
VAPIALVIGTQWERKSGPKLRQSSQDRLLFDYFAQQYLPLTCSTQIVLSKMTGVKLFVAAGEDIQFAPGIWIAKMKLHLSEIIMRCVWNNRLTHGTNLTWGFPVALILAVDDESSGLYFRKLILEHAGHTVLSTTGIDEALTLFRNNPVDLVVTDHLLGRETGTDMAAEMKRTKPSVPIILLSGTSTVPDPLLHADAFLSKTEGPEQLLGLIQRLLDPRGSQPS